MRALELKGDLPQNLDPRYQLGIQVLDLETAPYRYLRRAMRYQVFQAAGAVAAQHAQFSFVPPPNFGGSRPMLVHVRHFTFIAGATGYEVGFGLTAAGGGGTGTPLQGVAQDDRAYPGARSSGSTLLVGNAVASMLSAGARFMFIPANSSVEVVVDYVLTSRDITGGIFLTSVAIEVSQLNVAASLTVEFEERPLMTSEL
jgi:hypothetical protein